jgi:hypothetical protein
MVSTFYSLQLKPIVWPKTNVAYQNKNQELKWAIYRKPNVHQAADVVDRLAVRHWLLAKFLISKFLLQSFIFLTSYFPWENLKNI